MRRRGPLRHRFARTMVDHYRMERGQLMAFGGWASIDTVGARYYRSGKSTPHPPRPGASVASADAIRGAMALLQSAFTPTDPGNRPAQPTLADADASGAVDAATAEGSP